MRIGFIGLGVMGLPMARNLLTGGHSLAVYDLHRESCEQLGARVRIADSPADAARDAELVITMLPATQHVLAAVLGPDGVRETITPPTLYMDMSTIAPTGTRQVHDALAKLSVETLDVPVAGGRAGAEAGTLTLFIGAGDAALERVRPVLALLGKTLLHVGGAGAGASAKLVHNICNATLVGAFSEALVFGAKLGLKPEKTLEVLTQGSCANILRTNVRDIGLKRRFDRRTFPAAYMQKDLGLAKETAAALNMPLFYPTLSAELLAMLMAKGLGENTYTEIIKLFEDYAGVEASLDNRAE